MKSTTTKTLGAAGAAAATGAALAAAYYLYGSDKASQHRRALKSWAKSAEKEILSTAKQMKKRALTDQNLRALITEAAHRYELTKDLDPKDVRDFINSMQKKWTSARKMLSSDVVKGKQRRPKTAKKRKATRS